MPQSKVVVCDVPASSRIDWRLYYTEEKLRALKSKHIKLLEYQNHKDISQLVRPYVIVQSWMRKGIQELGMKSFKRASCLNHSTPSNSFSRITLYGTTSHSLWRSQIKIAVHYKVEN
jgi:hypothetical protein